MDVAKMIHTLDCLCNSMVNKSARFNMNKSFTIRKSHEWGCWFSYENKYGGTVNYSCHSSSLDKALAGLIDKLDAAGLLGDK